jgi:phenylacetate-coenzyme A ligase PaaK-like adenylate-forming protein
VNLYGGFTSFFTILEKMEAVQFPMGASTDFNLVADTIVKNKVTAILGMPSYLMQLFSNNSDTLKKYSGIKKIFFGGEHFSEAQQNYLKKNFGVEIIRSASYGSVDAGPLGYQCEHCKGGIHHLNERLHDLEVVGLFEDTPVAKGEVGRFLFTSKVRHGQKISRYEIGDVGRILDENCACGRSGTRFELLGRHGDVFRIGTIFLSYQKFHKILLDKFNFSGSFQLHLYSGTENKKEKIILLLENTREVNLSPSQMRSLLIENYPDLTEVVVKDHVLDFEVEFKMLMELEHNPKTGKLRSVIDHRFKT